MKIRFSKYQATGNDFVLIDNLSGRYALSVEQIKSICDRRFGVGADGLMLISKHPSANFDLQYYNSDGSQSLCGNGSRAAVKMAASLGLVNGTARFNAFDGFHDAEILSGGSVRLKMNDVYEVRQLGADFFINTGSPHFVRFVSDLDKYPVFDKGREIRYQEAFAPGGTNVNFVERGPGNSIFVRTYERGVEDETLSCGTGVTAAALASSFHGVISPVSVRTLGGDLQVAFRQRAPAIPVDGTDNASRRTDPVFEAIYLVGPAKMVFEGDLEL